MRISKAQTQQDDLLDPASTSWTSLTAESVSLTPVALDAQPNDYIKTAWADRAYGKTTSASATAQQAGEKVYIRLEWNGERQPDSEFPDAAAVLLGSSDAIGTLGSEEQPLKMWYWADGRAEPQSLTTKGPGVFSTSGEDVLDAAALPGDGGWAVVIAGPLAALSSNQLGVVIWNGSNDERAGLAAVSEWLDLDTE